MKSVYVKDIKPGVVVSSVAFVVVKVEKKVAKNGKEYIDLTLGDASGTILCKVWGEKYEACSADRLQEGLIVLATGTSNEFNGKSQMVMSMALPTDTYDEEDFVPVSKKNIEEMYRRLDEYISQVGDRHLKGLLKNIFSQDDFVKVFKKTPAAMKRHHAYVGGLLEHVLEVLDFAVPMCDVYQPCNKDLVITGIILHDIGKTEELVWKNMAISYSDRGRLLGHMQLGIEIIHGNAHKDFDAECLQLLKHIILSHHGRLEYGSCVMPATMEAKIVSLADDASAKLRDYKTTIDDDFDSGSSFSEYNRALETALYLKQYTSMPDDMLF